MSLFRASLCPASLPSPSPYSPEIHNLPPGPYDIVYDMLGVLQRLPIDVIPWAADEARGDAAADEGPSLAHVDGHSSTA